MVAGTNVLRLVCLLWLAPFTVHGFVTTLARKGEERVVRRPVVLAVDDHGSSSTNRRRQQHPRHPISVDRRWWFNDRTPLTAGTATATTRLYQSSPWWEGDDLRWSSRWRRRWFAGPKRRRPGDDPLWRPVTTTWCLVTLLLYVYQAFDTVATIRRRYPYVWPSQAPRVIFDVLLGTARMGPLTAQLAATTASAYQMIHVEPYRFVTAFLAHGSVLHWGFVMFTLLRQLPSYLETELGSGVFATVLLFSTVLGHWFALAALAGQGSAVEAYLLGGTTGISGLYGLLFVCLVRMGNPTTTRQVGKGIGTLFLYGAFLPHVSNLAHVGGFLAGVVLAMVVGPRYRSSYALRRKNSLAADPIASRQYRSAMGYDTMPTRPILPWPWLWAAATLALASQWSLYQSMPQMVWTILCRPMMMTGQ